MRLTDTQRSHLETALDLMRSELGDGITNKARRAYERAIPSVREIPEGQRRIRSDANGRRSEKVQAELEGTRPAPSDPSAGAASCPPTSPPRAAGSAPAATG